jgi:hypothetical protein
MWMAWSQLKAKIEERFAPSLAKRVSVHLTSYRRAVSEGGRGWLLVDQEEIPLASIQPFQAERTPGQHDEWSLHDALADYLNLALEDALKAKEPVHRALALIDRRLGRRRFEELQLANEHILVQRMYRLRAEAEGWRGKDTGAA